jgi:activator of Hsp90 ATPase-like protein
VSTVAFTWHPGQPAERASHVEVTFAAADVQTLVSVKHTGWDAFADPAAARAEYDHGWPLVLGRYQEHVAGGGEGDASDTWVALLHRPGPAAPQTGSLFHDPRFGEHVAFLNRRLPGRDRLSTATRLATEDDLSVAAGWIIKR